MVTTRYVHQLQNPFYTLTNEELDIHLQHFENSAMSAPINFFVKAIEKNTTLENSRKRMVGKNQ